MISVRTIALSIVACATLGACDSAYPQAPAAPAPALGAQIRTADFRLRSALNGQEYQVSVFLPPDYALDGTRRHAAAYLLHAAGPDHADFQQALSLLGSQAPDIFWVVISSSSDALWHAERAADATPSNNPEFDDDTFGAVAAAAEAAGQPMDDASLAALPRTGGAPTFVQVLETEIIPLIETSFRTSGDRAVGGHSLSGLLTSYILLERPDLFDRYLISSPSLWWDDFAMIGRAETLAGAGQGLPVRVFLSVGAEETDSMLRSKTEFEAALLSFEDLTLKTAQFDGANHEDVVLPAFLTGVPYLFAGTD